MSMLSAQIDKLRYEADMLRDHGTFIGYGGLTSTDPEMIECADLMCDAADTIWQLRDDLQRTNVDNARLQEMVTNDELCMQQMQDEVIRLRELARDALRPKYDKSMRMTPAQWRAYDADVLRRARELKVEAEAE